MHTNWLTRCSLLRPDSLHPLFSLSFYLLNKQTRKAKEDTHVGNILQKYTLERTFKPSYTFSSILESIHIFEHLSLHTHFWEAFMPSYTFFRSIFAFIHIFEHLSLYSHFWAFKPSYTFSGSIEASIHHWLITLIKCLKGHKSLQTLCDGPKMLIEWKFESIFYILTNRLTDTGRTYGPTYGRTYGRTDRHG